MVKKEFLCGKTYFKNRCKTLMQSFPPNTHQDFVMAQRHVLFHKNMRYIVCFVVL